MKRTTKPCGRCWRCPEGRWWRCRRRSASGWFHDEWHGDGDWKRVRITARDCPRISEEFLAEERRALGERYFVQEYLCEFTDTIDAVFRWEGIQSAMSDDVQPLFGPTTRNPPLFGR